MSQDELNKSQVPDPEVVPQAKRRRFSAKYKLRILEEADACRISVQSTLRQCLAVLAANAWLAIMAAPKGSRTLQMTAISKSCNSIFSWLSSCQTSCTALARETQVAEADVLLRTPDIAP
jgi:hypothetical protein